MQNFRALGAPPPDPRASGGWGLCPQTPSLRQLGTSPPDPHWPPAAGGSAPRPPNSPPIANFWLRAWRYVDRIERCGAVCVQEFCAPRHLYCVASFAEKLCVFLFC